MKLKLLHVGIAAAAAAGAYYLYQKRKEQTPAGMASATSGPRPHHHHHRGGGRRGGWGGYSVYGPDYPLVIDRTPNIYYENVWDGQKWVLVQRVL